MHESGFTKLFSTLITSTIWQEDAETKVVWITMLALANKYGEVPATLPGIANASGVSMEKVEKALHLFQQPDQYSRSQEFEGRRIERIDGGYQLLNYEKYRTKRDPSSRREQNRKAQEAYRSKQKVSQSKPK